MPRILFNFDAQSRNEVVHASGQWRILISPDFSQQFLASDNRSRAFAHVMENFHFTLCERGRIIASFRRVACEIETQVSEAYHSTCKRVSPLRLRLRRQRRS